MRDVVLAERVIERVVDDLRLDSETRRGVAIDGDGQLRRGILRVGRDVGQLRQRLELGQQARRPGAQLALIRVLQDVLKLAARDAAADGDVLRRLQEQLGARHLRELRPQPVDDLRSRRRAVVAQLEADDEAAGILRIAVAGAEERSEIGDVGVLCDDVGKLSLDRLHLGRRDVLAGFGNAKDQAGVLGREKALGDRHEENAGDRDRRQKHQQRYELVSQHDVEAAAIAVQQRIEAPFDEAIEPAMLAVMLADQKTRAQHRRQRQRHDDGNRDRGDDGDGEFVEQAADDAAHQQQRNEDGDQRNADRQHGEADFARALDRRLQRRRASFEVAEDVLDDDDGVVDHEADGDGQAPSATDCPG